ncbi:hypothetical protein SAMN04488516_102213 [Desulfonauticus submarinus]|uniref:Alginate export n=1 Tax=Desulfonauticus submarinus TaxID=206665 RepID=A0A1H0BLD4_9BACT|nr:hypothetical protein [Desulfonauticus submarinus]SDN46401.1 hypothetical protein SAMN04488516_102213 [Desulfonauticus submarinus]
MKKIILFFLCFFILGLYVNKIYAEDDLDLLNSLDTELQEENINKDENLLNELDLDQKKEKDKECIFKVLAKNLSGDFRIRLEHFWRKPDKRKGIDRQSDIGSLLLNFASYYVLNNFRFDFSGWLEGGNQKDTYAGVSEYFQDRDRRRRYAELNEIYLTYSASDYDLTVGKKIFKNGISTLYSPVDRHSPKDGNDPMDTQDYGLWQLKLDYYVENDSITFAILPVFQTSKSPSEYSRWTGSVVEDDKQVDSDFYTLDVDKNNTRIENEYPDVDLENIAYFAKVKGTRAGWDLFFSTYQGLNPYYVLKEEHRNGKIYYIKKNVFIGEYAGGFSTTYKKWEFHGEALYNHSYNSKDDNYVSYVLGLTYTIDDLLQSLKLKKMIITIEYGGEFVTQKQSAKGYIKSSQEMRPGRNDIFSFVRLEITDNWNLEYTSNFELSKGGRINRLISEYKFKSGLKWKAGVEFFNGGKHSYYGRWRKNDRIFTELIYPF